MLVVENERMTVSVAEGAALYGLSVNSFRKLVNRKDFPKVRVGRRIVIIRRQLTSYMEMLAEKGLAG